MGHNEWKVAQFKSAQGNHLDGEERDLNCYSNKSGSYAKSSISIKYFLGIEVWWTKVKIQERARYDCGRWVGEHSAQQE